MKSLVPLIIAGVLGLAPSLASAAPGSRLWATGGVTSFEGAAGGGLTPWALIAGYDSSQQWGGTVAQSTAHLQDYTLNVTAAAVSFDNRVELSLARQRLDLDTLGGRLSMDTLGLKVRLYGSALYNRWGEWSLGIEHKHDRNFTLPSAVGARSSSGTDVYLAASKLFFGVVAGRNLLLNADIRATKANQTGFLGFGGDKHDRYQPEFEGSAGVFINRQWLVGAEYRQKPDNLNFAKEDDWMDLFVAYVPNRSLAVTAAWVDLGAIAGLKHQNGPYLSVQGSF